jgi:hypothetical protein
MKRGRALQGRSVLRCDTGAIPGSLLLAPKETFLWARCCRCWPANRRVANRFDRSWRAPPNAYPRRVVDKPVTRVDRHDGTAQHA